jgi:hypothetical protein
MAKQVYTSDIGLKVSEARQELDDALDILHGLLAFKTTHEERTRHAIETATGRALWGKGGLLAPWSDLGAQETALIALQESVLARLQRSLTAIETAASAMARTTTREMVAEISAPAADAKAERWLREQLNDLSDGARS